MLVLVLCFIAVYLLVLYHRMMPRSMIRMVEMIPGPKTVPIIGNALEFSLKTKDMFKVILRLVRLHGPVIRIWIGPKLFIALMDPKYIEVIMNSNKHIDKAYFYRFLLPWLGTGLLTSTGQKWKTHRKFLTPTFHFKILEQFVEVFNSNGDILVKRLSKRLNGSVFDICPYITLCALDIISESAMGVTGNAQKDSNSKYVHAVREIGDIAMQRSFKPWFQLDFIFQFLTLGRVQKRCLATLHGTTNSVIKNRKKELLEKENTSNVAASQELDFGRKRRLAFLDLLILSSQDGVILTDEEIREEVDTFMFEGHDTTTSGICFALWALAKHQAVQEKVVTELTTIFGESDRAATFSDLQNMKYLEQVIKEAQRLYPSVPIYGRELTEDVPANGFTFPAGSNIVFLPFSLHRNAEYFPDPEKFDPDRFLPENCVGRHPYCYIPFAAGPRNCIGQKFAMLEMKATLSKLLRNYKLCLSNPKEELEFVAELVLKPANGVNLKLEPRMRKLE